MEASRLPGWVGTDQVLHFRFSGNRLILTASFPVKGEMWELEAVLVHCKEQGLSKEEAKALMDRYMEIHNEGNLALVDEIFHPEFVLKTPFLPEPIVGIQALKDMIANLRVTFSDFKGTIEEVVVKGDEIWSCYTMTGTNTGPLGDLPATGKKMHVTGMAITRVADGKIIEDQTYWNVLGLYQQLGFTLVPPQIEEKE